MATKTAPKRKDTRKRVEPAISRKGGATETSEAPARSAPSGRRGGPPRENAELVGPRFVGGPRNEHGTRVAKRVTCSRCGLVDHVPYVPRDMGKVLCRKCAIEILDTYEKGQRAKVPMRATKCNLCGQPFELPAAVEDDGDPLCKSCLMGFTAWQGSVDTPFEERTDVVVEERLSGTLVRRKKRPATAERD
jgi:formylmethanofuran dehydrogenase subunit E